MGFFGDLWAKQHGRQLMLSATAFGASAILLMASVYQLMFLQSDAEWGDFTGAAIGMIVVSSAILIVATPEFLNLKG